MEQTILMVMVGVLVVNCIILAVIAYTRRQEKSPSVALELLRPFAYMAIQNAYRTSQLAVEDVNMLLKGLDRKAVADKTYDLLPETIGKFPVGWIKSIVSREDFRQLIEDVYQEGKAFFSKHSEMYLGELDKLAKQVNEGKQHRQFVEKTALPDGN